MNPLDSNVRSLSEQLLEKHSYGYTLAVSPKKFFQYGKGGLQYGSLSHEDQKELLASHISKQASRIFGEYTYHRYEFELTKNSLVHVHGIIITDDHEKMLDFQMKLHLFFGFPRLLPEVCCKISRTVVHPKYWVDYMEKEQLKQIDFED